MKVKKSKHFLKLLERKSSLHHTLNRVMEVTCLILIHTHECICYTKNFDAGQKILNFDQRKKCLCWNQQMAEMTVTPTVDNSCLTLLNSILFVIWWSNDCYHLSVLKGKIMDIQMRTVQKIIKSWRQNKFYEGQKNTLVWKHSVLSFLTSLLTFIPDFLSWDEAISFGLF